MSKGKITVLVGISGSGKSTWAHEEWKKDPLNTIVISRDKIRELLFGYTEKSVKDYINNDKIFSLEKEVIKYEDTLIYESLESGKHVIIDSTNLTIDKIKRYEYWNVPIEIKDFNILVNKAIENDRKRVRQVGDKAILKQFEQFKTLINNPNRKYLDLSIPVEFKQDGSLPPCIIFDIDGTIAIKGDRSFSDWKRVGEDTLNSSVTALLDWMGDLTSENRPEIVICTGRDKISSYNTERWLSQNGLFYDQIHYRKDGDKRPDWIVKEEMWREIAKQYYITGMFDDRLQVVRRARALGLKVFHVEHNNF